MKIIQQCNGLGCKAFEQRQFERDSKSKVLFSFFTSIKKKKIKMFKTISPNGFQIHIKTILHQTKPKISNQDYLSLTDLAKYKSKNSKEVIREWIRLKSTLQFLTVWEELYNPEFKNPQIQSLNPSFLKVRNSHL